MNDTNKSEIKPMSTRGKVLTTIVAVLAVGAVAKLAGPSIDYLLDLSEKEDKARYEARVWAFNKTYGEPTTNFNEAESQYLITAQRDMENLR